jgi:hypothetical protein
VLGAGQHLENQGAFFVQTPLFGASQAFVSFISFFFFNSFDSLSPSSLSTIFDSFLSSL